MTEHDQKSIDEKFLESGDLFVLKYSNGYKFFEVETWKTLKFRPYDVGTVSAGSTQGFERLTDVNGDDILYVEQGDSVVLHASIGMSPASVRRYTNFPESENRLRTIPNLPNPSARNGDDYGFVDGEDSPFSQPTDAEELFIPPNTHLDFAFHNPSPTRPVSPKLNIKMRGYQVNEIDPSNRRNIVQRAMSPGSPIPVSTVGSSTNQKSLSGKVWDVGPVPESQIQRILGSN